MAMSRVPPRGARFGRRYSTAMPGSDQSVFISYRRDGGADVARLIQSYLEGHGFRVFLDVDELGTGHFDAQILKQIENCEHFLMICSPGALERCSNPDDWVRREIAHAIRCSRKIVPVTLAGFRWPSKESLPAEIATFVGFISFEYSHTHWRMSGPRLLGMLGIQPTDRRSNNDASDTVAGSDLASVDASVLTQSVDDRLAILRIREYQQFLAKIDVARKPSVLSSALRGTKLLPSRIPLRREAVCARAEFALELTELSTEFGLSSELLADSLNELRQPELLADATEQQLLLIVKLEQVIMHDARALRSETSERPSSDSALVTRPNSESEIEDATSSEPPIEVSRTPPASETPSRPPTPPPSWPPLESVAPTADIAPSPPLKLPPDDAVSSAPPPPAPVTAPVGAKPPSFSRFFMYLGIALLGLSLLLWLGTRPREPWGQSESLSELRSLTVCTSVLALIVLTLGALTTPTGSIARRIFSAFWILGLVWLIVLGLFAI